MKIFFYLPNVESGGAEKMIIALANEISDRGEDVTLILGLAEGGFLSEISGKVKIIELGTLSVLKSVFKLFSRVFVENPDILCVTKSHINTTVSLFAPFLKNTKIVLREANTPSVEYMYAGYYGKAIMLLGKLTYKLSAKYIGVSEGVSKDMTKFYGIKKENVKTIYNPVVSSELYKLSMENLTHPFFEERVKDANVFVFVAVGRLMKQKDYPTMIESFHRAHIKNNKIRLMILGRIEKSNIDYTNVIKKIDNYKLTNFIDFIGFVGNPFKYLSKANCFIQTSLFEGLPGTLVQGLALKKNIIATNCKSGPNEVLNYGEYGTLVEIGNVEQISEEMLNYSKGKTNPIADDGFINQFTSVVSTDKYLNMFKSLI
mgnify:CR=1 FL=1